MRLLVCAFFLLAGCQPEADPASRGSLLTQTGRLQDPSIDEASGLARSQEHADLLWVINDDGAPVLHAIDNTGAARGKVKLSKASNRDWEDLASFRLSGRSYLLIADIGDNDRKRKDVRLYIVEEPELDQKKARIAWQFDFRYPDGPRDAEAVAVDADKQRVLVLTKWDIPALLYELPLVPKNKKTVVARRLGVVDSLPQPRRLDVENAPITGNWFWQPSGMDINADGSAAVVLTYAGMYYYRRSANESWLAALQKPPLGLGLGRIRNAESIAFSSSSDAAFITTERKHAPLLRVDLSGVRKPAPAVTIMTFNVENLFDNVDDPYKDDKSYLPLDAKQSAEHVAACETIEVERWQDECLNLDWNDDVIEHKLGVLASTIKQVNDGKGADIIALQEVENFAILERLRNEFLADSDYLPAILIEGTDNRGIDVAFLTRLPLAGPATLHPLPADEFPQRAGDTRGVLEATFELPDGSLLTGFAVHFPAPFHPTEMRVLAYNHLNQLRASLPPDRHVFAAGDFNTTSTENAEQDMLDRFVRPYWTVAHELCDDCPGTAYYARDATWSFLDMILFAPASEADSAWAIRDGSVGLANRTAEQLTEAGTPLRYNSVNRVGVSDHWPLQLTLEPRP